ncbi:branched-chain amino acid ABC transporter, permease protein [Anaerococcus lactolyticus ATCC 51172]|uniref:Branched-chain amino acid ABC transporter, permease protein n=1 Tax=Anaerococcus lactolyticus ATCC 51172 TaxID=525254 RepID=C2BF59_9FIRM|nr:ABC transporter [Anaerococcus lactolyticus]EEI86457.1 branched-chain amino acid ABC transporter, permease protein [Anaerococcus lactolyticus ATCC 51172]
MIKNKISTRHLVPIMFMVICVVGYILSGAQLGFITSELANRLVRNTFLVLSLIIPIIAGMGINFGIPLGAMAAQVGLIFSQDLGFTGLLGIAVAAVIAFPIAIVLGIFSGNVLNRAKGREMITSMMLSFFMLGVYMLVIMFFTGTIIPIRDKSMLLSSGVGIKNSISLATAGAIDNALKYRIQIPLGKDQIKFDVPVLTIFIIGLLCVFITYFKKTKLGQNMRAVGLDQDVANNSGLNADKIRVKSIIYSTVLAAFGQLIYLQNIGTLATYAGLDQAALYAAAALLVGGASILKASIVNAIIGTALFHLMFIIMPLAGKEVTGDAMVGEFLRTFISYAIVTISLILHEYNRKKEIKENRLKAIDANQKAEKVGA